MFLMAKTTDSSFTGTNDRLLLDLEKEGFTPVVIVWAKPGNQETMAEIVVSSSLKTSIATDLLYKAVSNLMLPKVKHYTS